MTVCTVDLMVASATETGAYEVISYADYHWLSVDIDPVKGSAKKITFTPYSGTGTPQITGIQLDDGAGNVTLVPCSFGLWPGAVVTFAAGSIKTTAIDPAPVVVSSPRHLAYLILRRALLELINDDSTYAQQDFPEKPPFTVIYLMDSKRDLRPFNDDYNENNWHRYWYNAKATAVIVRAGEGAQNHIEHFFNRMNSIEGDMWQYKNGVRVDRSGDFENVTPIIDKLSFDEMAQVTVSLGYVFAHYERDAWIDHVDVNGYESATIFTSVGD